MIVVQLNGSIFGMIMNRYLVSMASAFLLGDRNQLPNAAPSRIAIMKKTTCCWAVMNQLKTWQINKMGVPGIK